MPKVNILKYNQEIDEEEFEALKDMAKEAYRWYYFGLCLVMLWLISLLIGFCIRNMTLFVALSIVYGGLATLFWICNCHPKRYDILDKER